MKKYTNKILAAVLSLILVLSVVPAIPFTAGAESEGPFTYEVDGGEATITGLVDEDYSGAIEIPSVIDGYPVTTIGDWAFEGCTGLTSINIPDSVTSIGDDAFSGCSGLTSIDIPDSVTEIGDGAFSGCSGLTSIDIPDSVTEIGDGAFSGCSGLTSVTIGNSVTSIGYHAFYYCSGLTSITIPDSVTSIGDYAFYYCSGLTSITIPDLVTEIGYWAFAFCSGLTSVTIGNSVTEIGVRAFYCCNGLTSVTIPDSVTEIGYWAFNSCSGLTSINIPDSVTSIGDGAFDSCSGLESIIVESGNPVYHSAGNCLIETETKTLIAGCKNSVIPTDGSVTSIGDGAFYGCSGLTSITIPDSVTSIGNYAFSDCSGLTSVTIGNSVTSIGDSAFLYCSGLTSINIPNSVTSISDSAFEDCTGLESIIVGSGNKVYHSTGNCIIETETKTLIAGCKNSVIPTDGSVTSIGDRAFSDCSGLTSITIPDSVTSIGLQAFDGCSWLTSIIIPDSVTSIGDGAFDSCSGLTSINIPDSVTSIGDSAFYGCAGLNSVTIGNGVTLIGDWVFYRCTGLTSITIPDSVTSIGNDAFSYCSGLTSITIPDSVTSIGYGAFRGCKSLISLNVPDVIWSIDCSAFYGTAWYANQPDGLIYIGKVAYTCKNGCPEDVIIKDGTLRINERAFVYDIWSDYDTWLESITIPDSVTSIGSWAFSYCSGLTSINIPDSVTEIGDGAFWGCRSITDINIPENVQSIGTNPFEYCDSIVSITVSDDNTTYHSDGNCLIETGSKTLIAGCKNSVIPTDGSVTIIGIDAFYGCTGLAGITIPDSITSIGAGAFDSCYWLKYIILPDSLKEIGSGAFSYCDDLTDVYYTGTEQQKVYIVIFDDDEWSNNQCLINATWHYNYVPGDPINVPYDISYNDGFYNYSVKNGEATITGLVDSDYSGAIEIPSTIGGYPVTTIDDWAFEGCTGLTSITIPDSITSIGYYAFFRCSGLTSVTIPDSVTSIGDYAFSACSGLESIIVESGNPVYHSAGNCIIETETKTLIAGCKNSVIPTDGSVTSIGDGAFDDCTGLMSVTIPDSVTSIGGSAFYYCSGLTSVTIPDSVTSIGDYAFSACSGLESIIVESGNPVYHSAGNCIIETETKTLIAGCKNSVIPTDGSVTSIGDGAFDDCTGLTSITIPDSVTSIGNWVFYGCSGLTSINIPDSVTSIGDGAFDSCSGLTSINIPDSVTSIGDGAFDSCSGLTSINIPDSVTSIGNWVFDDCTGLTSITIPDSVTSISDGAFYGCTGLTSITIPDSVTSIGDGAFYGCTGLADVYYSGTEQQKENIDIYNDEWSENDCLLNATWHYNYVPGDPICHHTNTEIRNATVPTCTEAGYTGDTYCLDCGAKTATGEVIAALGHNFGGWYTTKEPTCTEEGIETRICANDITHIETRSIDVLSHISADKWTATESGHFKKCTVCGTEIRGSFSSHDFETIVESPTIEKEGTSYKVCRICGYVDETTLETIPKLISYKVEQIFGKSENGAAVYDGNDVRSISFGVNFSNSKFCAIKVNDEVISPDNYTVFEGKAATTIVKPADIYLMGLVNGNYTITFVADDGYAETTLKVNNNTIYTRPIIVVENKTISCDSTVDVSIYLMNNPGITSMKLKIDYDGELELKKAIFGDDFLIDDPYNMYQANITKKPAIVNWSYGSKDVSGNNLFATLTFKIPEDAIIGDKLITVSYSYSDVFDTNYDYIDFAIANGRITVINCEHENTTIINAKEATYTHSGYTGDTYCHDCGGIISNGAIIPMLDDNTYTVPTIVVDNKTAKPGDTVDVDIYLRKNPGITSIKLYIDYDDELELISAALGEEFSFDSPYHHSFDLNNTKKPAVVNWCYGFADVSGNNLFVTLTFKVSEGAAIGDKSVTVTYPQDDVFDIYENDVAFDISNGKITVLGDCQHNRTEVRGAKAATCTEEGYTGDTYCVDCGAKIATGETIPALGHSFTNYISNNDATCTADGTKTAKCDRCDVTDTVTDIGSKLGHNYNAVVTDPTCTERGYTTHTCSRCQDSYIDNYTNALGHSFTNYISNNDATCTADGTKTAKCDRCDVTDTVTDIGSKLGHNYNAVVTDPTCTEQGYTTHTCSRCQDSYVDNYTNALGHTGGTATCASRAVCTRCQQEYGEFNANNHDGETEIRDAKAATCTEAGYTGDTYCISCGVKIATGENIPTLSHIPTDWITDKYATLTEEGSKHIECSICGEILETAVIPVIEQNAPRIEVESKKATAGKTVKVNISLINNPGITTAKLKVNYAEGLTLKNVTFGDIGGQAIVSEQLESPATLNWFNGLENLETANVVYATLTFEVAQDTEPGLRDITVEYDPNDICDINDTNVTFAVINGKIEITDSIPGDINGDDAVNNKDLTRLFQYLSDWDVEVNEAALDINGDGSVNNKDLTRLFQYLSDWDVYIF